MDLHKLLITYTLTILNTFEDPVKKLPPPLTTDSRGCAVDPCRARASGDPAEGAVAETDVEKPPGS